MPAAPITPPDASIQDRDKRQIQETKPEFFNIIQGTILLQFQYAQNYNKKPSGMLL